MKKGESEEPAKRSNQLCQSHVELDTMANILETAAAAGTFTHFLEHAKLAGLDVALSSTGPITVFAPTDEAVAKLSPETQLAVGANVLALNAIVGYHILEGKYTSVDLEGLSTATTVQGEDVKIRVDGGRIKVDGAHITKADIAADNGVIHAIDTVLVPEAAALVLQS